MDESLSTAASDVYIMSHIIPRALSLIIFGRGKHDSKPKKKNKKNKTATTTNNKQSKKKITTIDNIVTARRPSPQSEVFTCTMYMMHTSRAFIKPQRISIQILGKHWLSTRKTKCCMLPLPLALRLPRKKCEENEPASGVCVTYRKTGPLSHSPTHPTS